MGLAEFILRDMEAILVEWEAFAITQFPASAQPTKLTLRNHARQILEAVAKDLPTSQSRQAQEAKSQGLAPKPAAAPDTAAETHAVLRAKSGFDINQMVAEYRALRATVLRLWIDRCQPDHPLQDIMRFNEAIDQAIAESVASFSVEVEQTRNLLFGMLGHDMRSPLNTIQATATYLAALHAGPAIDGAASRLNRSGASMKTLLDDLVDFSRTQLGLGINISRTDVNLADLFADELEQFRGAHPDRQLELTVSGATRGFWDGTRVQQLLRNLVSNALKYGVPGGPVHISLLGRTSDVLVEVRNSGTTAEGLVLDQMFDPLTRGPVQENDNSADAGLGLGLYIVRQVALAHGGEATARAETGETVFSVRLPRREPT